MKFCQEKLKANCKDKAAARRECGEFEQMKKCDQETAQGEKEKHQTTGLIYQLRYTLECLAKLKKQY